MGSSGVMSVAAAAWQALNAALSFVVFSLLDALEVLLCFVYRLVDFASEGDDRKPCYCSSLPSDIVAASAATVTGCSSKVVVVSMISATELKLEDVSETLYSRPSLLTQANESFLGELRRLKLVRRLYPPSSPEATAARVRMLQGKMGGVDRKPHPRPRWSDCSCRSCNSSGDGLYVHVESPQDGGVAEEDVVFIHGFISSSGFWTETVFRHFTEEARARYRLIAVDLLGFGKSPKPADSLYTLREHVDMLEKCVLERHHVKSFHIVAHSLGSLLALAIAVRHPGAVKSLTIVSPPYFPVPGGEEGTQYLLRRAAPRRVWPVLSFGSSVVCYYEHISRTVCLLICKHHRLWTAAFKLLTLNKVRTYLMEGFFQHTHHAAWHTLHNIIFGTGGKVVDGFLDAVREKMSCDVVVYHGRDDELLPPECSYAVGARIPRARVQVVDGKDHITIVVGRQKTFAGELEEIWGHAADTAVRRDRTT